MKFTLHIVAALVFITCGISSTDRTDDSVFRQSQQLNTQFDSAVIASGPFISESIATLGMHDFMRTFHSDISYINVRNTAELESLLINKTNREQLPKYGCDVRCVIILYGPDGTDSVGLDAISILYHDTTYFNDSLISYVRYGILKDSL